MLTGLYPHAHGLTENDGRFGGRSALGPDEWMVHRQFARMGYRTAWFGKWHLDNTADANRFGFEGWSLPGYGYPYGTEAYADYLHRKVLPSPVAEVEVQGESSTPPRTRLSLTDLGDWPDYEAGSLRLDAPAETHEAFFVADLARDWIIRNAGEPFFLRIDPWGPHPPYLVPDVFDGYFGNEIDFRTPNFHSDLAHRPAHHREYRDEWLALSYSDDDWRLLARRSLEQAALVETAMIGVVDALEAAGIADRTIVIACADHGDAVASNGGTANKGGLLVEETVRIPLAITGPSIPVVHVSHAAVTNLDIAPFILTAAGLPRTEELHGDGSALQVQPNGSTVRDGVMLQHYGLHQRILQRAWHTGSWKLILQPDGFNELYDLAHDPNEMSNLANNSDHAATLEDLRDQLLREMIRVGDAEGQLLAKSGTNQTS